MLTEKRLEVVTFTSPEDDRAAKLASGLFSEAGHVAIQGLFEPELADDALEEIRSRPLRAHTVFGCQETVTIPTPIDRTESPVGKLLQRLHDGAAVLGQSLVDERGWKSHIQMISMEAGMRGPLHADNKVLDDITAITNLSGESLLVVPEADAAYFIEPGVVVYIDGKDVPHQGVATESGTRIGLAASRLPTAAAA